MSITFNDICDLLEALEKISTEKVRLDAKKARAKSEKTISEWFARHRQALDDHSTNGGAILSIILPHWRKDRVYNLQSAALSKKLAKVLSLNHGRVALLNSWMDRGQGDLGACIERVTKPWDGTFARKIPTPVEQVDRLLTQLAAKCRFSSPALRKQFDNDINTDRLLKNVLIKLESWEAKWLVRLILSNYCTVVLDEDFVLKKFHFLLPDLLRFQNDFTAAFELLSGDLSCYPADADVNLQRSIAAKVAKQLKPIVGIKLGRPTFRKAWSLDNCFKMVGNHAWSAEIKYDGEYCEIHIDLEKRNDIQIFSKNGKDATNDRRALHGPIRQALRIGESDCLIKRKAILLGEMVVYSDQECKILELSKIRKHISRSGSFFSTAQDSAPHEWEHLMIVFFDVLLLDDEPILAQELQKRRDLLRQLVHSIPGRAMRARWCLIDGKLMDGISHLKEMFGMALADREEGLVLKPLHEPYLPVLSDPAKPSRGYYIKLKKDYLADMGGARDLGDFAVIGASYDAQVASKSNIKPIHYTHFHLGCLTNKTAVRLHGEVRKFKVVAAISIVMCIPKADAQWLNERGSLMAIKCSPSRKNEPFEVVPSYGGCPPMAVLFKEPFVVEVLGGGYEKAPNETFYMLRHPRVRKVHQDRTWEDTVTMEDLDRMSRERWAPPDAGVLSGHARDVTLVMAKFEKLNASQESYQTTQKTSQETATTDSPAKSSQHTSQDNGTQRTGSRSPQESQDPVSGPDRSSMEPIPESMRSEIPETPQMVSISSSTITTQFTSSTRELGVRASNALRFLFPEGREIQSPEEPQNASTMTTQFTSSTRAVGVRASNSLRKARGLQSPDQEPASASTVTTQFTSSTRALGAKASNALRFLIREDTAERLLYKSNRSSHDPKIIPAPASMNLPTPPGSSPENERLADKKRKASSAISPPKLKRPKILAPVKATKTNA